MYFNEICIDIIIFHIYFSINSTNSLNKEEIVDAFIRNQKRKIDD